MPLRSQSFTHLSRRRANCFRAVQVQPYCARFSLMNEPWRNGLERNLSADFSSGGGCIINSRDYSLFNQRQSITRTDLRDLVRRQPAFTACESRRNNRRGFVGSDVIESCGVTVVSIAPLSISRGACECNRRGFRKRV